MEVIFPVSQDAVSATGSGDDLAVVPGVRGGEGCSTAGTPLCVYVYKHNATAWVKREKEGPRGRKLFLKKGGRWTV